MLDWTYSVAERITIWKWASLSCQATQENTNDQVELGINFSDHVYNDDQGISQVS